MNFVACVKQGHRIHFGGTTNSPADGSLAALPDGPYTAGFRANHLHLNVHSGTAIDFPCEVAVPEITGSETFLHATHSGHRWVGLVHGVHSLRPGQHLNLSLIHI